MQTSFSSEASIPDLILLSLEMQHTSTSFDIARRLYVDPRRTHIYVLRKASVHNAVFNVHKESELAHITFLYSRVLHAYTDTIFQEKLPWNSR